MVLKILIDIGQKKRKRSFRENQYTAEKSTEFVSTSTEKLKDKSDFEIAYDNGSNYTILCFLLVFTALQSILKCKLCNSDVQFLKKSPRDLGFKLCVKCFCQEFEINSCPMIKNSYEINRL